MIPGLNSIFGGGMSALSSASSGPATTGNQGVQIGGIQTGGSGGIPQWVLIAGVVLAALYVLRRR